MGAMLICVACGDIRFLGRIEERSAALDQLAKERFGIALPAASGA